MLSYNIHAVETGCFSFPRASASALGKGRDVDCDTILHHSCVPDGIRLQNII